MKNTSITTAVIAAAGYGTRFLPATKVIPKEMLPIIDRPIIQYLVEEAVASGITNVIIVVRSSGGIIERHFSGREFDTAVPLDDRKRERLRSVKELSEKARLTFVEQGGDLPYGNASPMISARGYIPKGEPFVYMFGDDMTLADKPVTKQIIDFYDKHLPDAVLAVQEVSDDEVERYGTVLYKENPTTPYAIAKGVEKVPKSEAPSNMAQFGRFVLTDPVLREAEKLQTGKDDELWVIDILNALALSGKTVSAVPIDGKWLTTGDPLRYLQTAIAFAQKIDDMKDALDDFIREQSMG